MSDRQKDVVVRFEEEENVGTLVEKVKISAGLDEGFRVRLVYLGKM
jgi:hypothetical protein